MTPGSKLGPYEIVSPIGAGGMGEVWKARDTRLDRIVAIKVSKQEFSERFEREARAVAALNHPHICTLHDVGPNYLVFEYVDGQPLKGPMPLDQALAYAAEICDALDAAHSRKIVHRDLKPANILVTKTGVKLLDFGLAKIEKPVTVEQETMTIGLTAKGQILGTLAYMSPEQLQGQEADARSDIFSFGCVLYEMLTGKRAFDGASAASVIAAILERPAPSVADIAPAALNQVLQRCTEKDPENRWQSARDLKSALDLASIPAGPTSSPSIRSLSRLGIVGWAIAGAMMAALLAALVVLWPKRPVARPLEQLSVDLGPDAHIFGNFSSLISPDGARLLYIAGDGRKEPSRLALRRLDQAESTVLPGTIGGVPFFSADSQWIGVFSNGKVRKISVQGGGAIPLFDLPSFAGASWGANGFIVAARQIGGLLRVPDTGGTPQEITELEAAEQTHRWPQILPGGKAVQFTVSDSTTAFEDARIKAVALDTGVQKTLVRGGYFGRYIPSNGTGRGAVGHLVYLHQRVLFAAPFDPARLELRGNPVPLIDGVAGFATEGSGHFSFSNDGTFVYLSGAAFVNKWPVELMDQTGQSQTLISKPGQYRDFRFSSDGRRLALSLIAEQGQDIYVYDRERDSMTRLTTTNGQQNMAPVWAPDGKHLVYADEGVIFWIRSDGAGAPQQLYRGSAALPFSFSPDGRRLAYWEAGHGGSGLGINRELPVGAISTLPLDLTDPEHPKPGKPDMFLQAQNGQGEPAFSPDGRWMAYASRESGTPQVYVRPFPGPGGKWQISTEGGQIPMWSRAGSQLFYRGADSRIMVADYMVLGDTFTAGKPRVWADRSTFDPGSEFNMDIAPDGKHFAFFRYESVYGKGNLHVTFLLNFFDELRRRAPEAK